MVYFYTKGKLMKKYFWIQIKFITGNKRWFWCSPKLTHALNLEKSLNPSNYQSSILGTYMVVPYRPYTNGIEHLTLGKVIAITRSNKRTYSWRQTRSQFLTVNNIGTKLGYDYIRHDYHRLTRMHLWLSNFIWGLRANHKR